jgi:membrane-bound lytic murein transglycosylase D
MMKLRYFFLFFALISIELGLANDIPRVPNTIEFAGMKLKLSESARFEIQKDVDALHSSRKYFDIKLDRVNLYFPIIERIFKEENLPEDFKYLVIQESALISDAVSSANAVGFWQFKDFTGREVGLRIDNLVDERLNIVSATQGAAKYLSRHNFYFDNWIYSLLAYNTGRGGAQRFVKKDLFGVRTMDIDQHTHWYVKKFLAHKIAFESEIGNDHSEGLKLIEYEKGTGKNLDKIAKELGADSELLNQYNKWLLKGDVPDDKTYMVLVPTFGKIKDVKSDDPQIADGKNQKVSSYPTKKTYPTIGDRLDGKVNKMLIRLNGIPAIMAQEGDDLAKLAVKANIKLKKLARINEVNPDAKVSAGEFYYIKTKSNKGDIYNYVVQDKEDLWDISQKFGMKVSKLAKYNRMEVNERPKRGRVLWLRSTQPADEPIEYEEVYVAPSIVEKKAVTKPTAKPEVKVQPTNTKPEATPQKNVAVTKPSNIDTALVTKAPFKKAVQPPEKLVKAEVVTNPEKSIIKAEDKPKETSTIHVVQTGETLYGISKKYGVSVADIKEWNKLESDVVKLDQQLVVTTDAGISILETQPSVQELPKKEVVTFHEVQPGETLYGISRKYNIPIDKLMQLNDKSNFVISVGEKLKVVE